MSFISGRVKNIIAVNGMDITLIQRTSTYNKVTGENTSIYVNSSIKGFVRKYKPEELAGGLVLQHDREVKIAVDGLKAVSTWVTDGDDNIVTESGGTMIFIDDDADLVPKEQDLIMIDSKKYQIVSVETRNAKGADCMYVIQVRGNAN